MLAMMHCICRRIGMSSEYSWHSWLELKISSSHEQNKPLWPMGSWSRPNLTFFEIRLCIASFQLAHGLPARQHDERQLCQTAVVFNRELSQFKSASNKPSRSFNPSANLMSGLAQLQVVHLVCWNLKVPAHRLKWPLALQNLHSIFPAVVQMSNGPANTVFKNGSLSSD